MQETINIKLKKPEYNEYADIKDINDNMDILDEKVQGKLDTNQADNLYAPLSHRHNTNDIDNLSETIKTTKVDNAENANTLDNLDSLDFVRSMPINLGKKLSREVFDNTEYPSAYIGAIDFGTQVGLPSNFCKIIYLPNQTGGYGTQMAIPYDNGIFTTMYIRNSHQKTWGTWNNMRTQGNAENNAYRNTTDANTALESGKLYYCVYNQCSNIPNAGDDGILLPLMHRTDTLYGMQLYMTWNNDSLWTRNIIGNNFTAWRCISGGQWNSPVNRDSEQVGKYIRWKHYGQNHVIFDASNGTTPSGRSCDRHNSENNYYSANCPNLMGWNGHQTYGLGVDRARTAEQVQGFQFKNNNGRLEVLVNGVWLSVGGKNYTVTRQGAVGSPNPPWNGVERFDYSGGAGILRLLDGDIHYGQASPDNTGVYLYVDGVQITRIQRNFSYPSPLVLNLEFKNSISIVRVGSRTNSVATFIIQTEK